MSTNSSANGRLRSSRDRDLLVQLLLERAVVAEAGEPVASASSRARSYASRRPWRSWSSRWTWFSRPSRQ